MNSKPPEFLIKMLEEQYGKQNTLKIMRRISNKKKNHIKSKHLKSKKRRNNRKFKPKSDNIQNSRME